jgi:hypothetical protein
MKYVGYLLNPGNHFSTSEYLTEVVPTQQIVKMTAMKNTRPATPTQILKAIKDAKAANAEEIAGMAIDNINDPAAAQIAAACLNSQFRPIRKAGLFIYAKRPEIEIPTEKIITALRAPAPEGYLFDLDLINYSLTALAIRKKLPESADFNTRFSESYSTTVRLTYTWCLGVNNNRYFVPFLIKQTADKNMRVRVKAALALGALGDPAALPTLTTMTTTDHRYAQDAAKSAIAMINKGVVK